MLKLSLYLKIKQIIKFTINFILSLTGIVYFRKNIIKKYKNIKILLYHSVSDTNNDEISVTKKQFEQQMEYISKNYDVISLDEAFDYLKLGNIKKENALVITFDDGYKDNFYNAYPILSKFNLKATIFLISNYINTSKKWPPGSNFGSSEYDNRFLSWDEVGKMDNNVISFGSHTVTHPLLSQIKNKDELYKELTESKDVIEKSINKKVTSFSYPIGVKEEITTDIVQAVKECGYSYACSAITGVNYSGDDTFTLKRIGIDRTDSMYIFKKKVEGALDILSIKDTILGQKVKNLAASLFGIKSYKERYYKN